MFRGTIEEHSGTKLIGMDTITDVHEEDAATTPVDPRTPRRTV